MSRGSQQKRARRAKERARQRASEQQAGTTRRSGGSRPSRATGADGGRPGPTSQAPWYAFPPNAGPPPLSVVDLLEEARAGAPFAPWAEAVHAVAPARFHAAAEATLTTWVRQCYGAGWQPTELLRAVSTRTHAGGAQLLRLAVTAERDARTGPTRDDPRWLDQWRSAQLPEGAVPSGWLARWAALHEDWLRQFYRTAMVLGQLPILELLLPPPPGVRSHQPAPTRPAGRGANPMLNRVRALLAKAESSEHESEALAFTAKAQELITRHALGEALLGDASAQDQAPTMIRIPIDAPYLDAKALLLQTIAECSRCRTLLDQRVALSSVIGFPTDLAAVELLFTSLLVQAQTALAEAGSTAPAGSRVRSQSFRAAFFQGFTARIGERLAAANEEALDGEDSAVYLPVLRARDERVEEFVEQRFRRVSSRVRGGYDPHGYHRGQEAGDTAAIVMGAVEE